MESSVNEKEHVEMVYIPQGELIKDEIIYSITTYPNSDYVEFETTVYHQKIHTRILTTGNKAEVIGKEKFKFHNKIKELADPITSTLIGRKVINKEIPTRITTKHFFTGENLYTYMVNQVGIIKSIYNGTCLCENAMYCRQIDSKDVMSWMFEFKNADKYLING